MFLSYLRSSEYLVFYTTMINQIWRNTYPDATEVENFKTCIIFLKSPVESDCKLEDTLIGIIAKCTAS